MNRQLIRPFIVGSLLVFILVLGLLLAPACDIISTSPTATPATPSLTPEPTSEASPTPTATPTPGSTDTPSGELTVHFIDVGQGDAILIDLQETEIIIDGGGRSPGVTEYLNEYVDGPLEVMVATHRPYARRASSRRVGIYFDNACRS